MHKHAVNALVTSAPSSSLGSCISVHTKVRGTVVPGMAAPSNGATRKSLISRTLERCKSGLNRIGTVGRARSSPAAVAGCFPVYVGPERVRFVVRAEYASHLLFRRLLDDAEREYGHAARDPLALPCDVDAFLDVLWHMEHGDGGDDDGDEVTTAVSSSPICGLRSFSKNRAAGYRMMNPRFSPVVARIGEHRETKHARTRSYS